LVLLVLDEQLAGRKLLDALEGRGLAVKTLGDFGVTGPDRTPTSCVESMRHSARCGCS
jgi:hypothetical protein